MILTALMIIRMKSKVKEFIKDNTFPVSSEVFKTKSSKLPGCQPKILHRF